MKNWQKLARVTTQEQVAAYLSDAQSRKAQTTARQ
jgi:hypothetical protein